MVVGPDFSDGDGEATGNFENIDFGRYEVEGEETPQTPIIVGDDGTAQINAATTFMSSEAFYQNFEGMFTIAGHATGNGGFPIQQHEKTGARATSDLIYEQCKKVTWLNWMVAEQGSDAAKYISVAMFGFGKYQAVRAGYIEMAEAKQQEATNDDD